MLELKSVTWRNFMSYGDYDTTVELDNLGQCLITGEVIGEDKVLLDSLQVSGDKSNGAGKSTIVNVIQWILFGKTMHSSSPGDKVINYFTGKDCVATLQFKSGDFITRTRKSGNHSELHYVKDGDESSLTSDTLSTTKHQQKQLNRLFGLDWEIFCGSVFFNQYGKPWMEMADATRKKAIERVLHVDRFMYYAKNAKGKVEKLDSQIEKKRNKITNLEDDITRLNNEIGRLEEASKTYNSDKLKRIQASLQQAIEEKTKRDEITRPDLDKLKEKWATVEKIEEHINFLRRNKQNSVTRTISSIDGTIDTLNNKIQKWEEKSGQMCTSCDQEIPASHVSTKIDPIKELLTAENGKKKRHEEELERITDTIKTAGEKLEKKRPKMTMREANDLHRSWERHDKALNRFKGDAQSIKDEENPHLESIESTKAAIDTKRAEIENLKQEIERETFLNSHYRYIYKAYNDRTKIKSFVFREHVPFINSRLRHYLDVFGLDIKIELTSALGVSSNMWGYEFQSGGERKRTDVAFMLAMFDFHEQMYGRQCNILVLDEVDGRLDDDGIDSLIGIIKNDLASKVESILVISHKNLMRDTFNKELRVRRTDRLSQLIDIA